MKKKQTIHGFIRPWTKLFLIMRLSILLFFAFVMATQARSFSQSSKLTLDLSKVKLVDVLNEIEDQTDYYFYFNLNIDNYQVNQVNAKDQDIREVLNKMLPDLGLDYEIVDRYIVIKRADEISRGDGKLAGSQQQIKVSGKVTDSTGASLPGVSVVLKGTTTGTITDFDGNYTLSNIPSDATLVFSFVGMRMQEVKVAGKTTVNVELTEETVGVEEVVVVGYGTIKKVNLTGSVASVKVDEKMVSRTLPSLSTAMSGLVPGLTVSQNTGMAGKNDFTLMVRGLGTVNNTSPLIVVDGMPDVDINRINMNDVESISVLKDATSSAIYGSRAANGVILVTTKTGKGMTKTSVTFSSSYAIEHPTKSWDFMANYPRALTLHQRNSAVGTAKANWLFKDGTIDQWMALGMIDPLRYPNTDWWDIIIRNGSVQKNNISLTGGNEKSNFFISIGTMDEKGLQINNDYSLYNARFNYDYKVRPNMNVGVKFSGNWSKFVYSREDGFTDDQGGSSAFDLFAAIAGITPYDPVTGLYGGVMAYNEDVQAYNPLVYYTNDLTRKNRQEANSSIYLDWTPFKGLTAKVDYTLNYYNQFTYRAPIPATSYNFQTNSYGSRVYFGENSGIYNYTHTGYKTLLNGHLSYEKRIASNHEFKALFVYSEEYWYDRYQMASRDDRFHPSLHEIDAALTEVLANAGNSNTEGLRSYIGRLNYSAFDKYLLEANFRYDGSSKFLKGYRYGFFPSVSVGWRFTEENFISPFTRGWLTSGKLRVSYGGLGNNSGVKRYEQRETLSTLNYMLDDEIIKGFAYSKMVNRDLSWEATNILNIGLDLSTLDSRLTAELDYYDRLTTGMIRPSDMSLHLTGAYTAPNRNIGELRNRGVEGIFTWKDRIGKDFTYSVQFNASHNRTTLEKWNEYLGRGNVFIGMPYQFAYSYVDRGIAQTWQDIYNATPQNAQPGDILREDLNGDGRISDEDKKADPNNQRNRPTTNYGLNASFAWKGFDFSILFQGTAGRKEFWLNVFNNVNIGSARFASTWDHWYNPWSIENRDGIWPRIGGNGNREETTFYLDDLSYLRLKNIQLGYTLPKKLMKLGIDHVRIYGSAENLATFTKFRGIDPEKVAHVSDVYPLVKSFSFGIVVGF
jgi:TonB-linked SusC/RagA family outer membrane protein